MEIFSENELRVTKIPSKEGREFIKKNHYSKSCHNGPMCWGLYRGSELVGVCAFATPCSEAVRASIFGPDEKDRVTELHRLFTQDGLPKNTESWFVTRAIKGLLYTRPHLRAIISFADATEGHVGFIYQALNFYFYGKSNEARFFRDSEGRLRHPRQSGVNISNKEAEKRGWIPELRAPKYKYVLLVGPKNEQRKFKKLLKVQVTKEYPKS